MLYFKLQCECDAICWVRGWEESDTNACGIDENEILEWEKGSDTCEHEEWQIIDQEYESDEDYY